MREQFLVNLQEIGINNFIGDIKRNLNKITKKDIIRRIQEAIILEYDMRTIAFHNVKDSLYKATLPICNIPKTDEEKSDDAIMFKNNKVQRIHQMIVCDGGNSEEVHLLSEYEIMIYPYKTDNGIFFQTVSGSNEVNGAIEIVYKDWDAAKTTLQAINCTKKYKPVCIKPNFLIFNSEMAEIEDELMAPIERAKKLLKDITIWSKYYDSAIENIKNEKGERATVGDIMEERYQLICSNLKNVSWNDILKEEF